MISAATSMVTMSGTAAQRVANPKITARAQKRFGTRGQGHAQR